MRNCGALQPHLCHKSASRADTSILCRVPRPHDGAGDSYRGARESKEPTDICQNDPDLAAVVEARDRLPEGVRQWRGEKLGLTW
jgi:hypothetical protein